MKGVEAKRIIQIIQEHEYSVTASDVSSTTGMPLKDVVPTLEKLTSRTDGAIDVTESGETVYRFSVKRRA